MKMHGGGGPTRITKRHLEDNREDTIYQTRLRCNHIAWPHKINETKLNNETGLKFCFSW